MILSTEERDAWEQMLADAWAETSRAPMVANRLEVLLLDAERSGEGWAKQVLADSTSVGLQKFAKEWRRKQADTDKGPVSITAGVIADGEFVQLELVDCNYNQLKSKLDERNNRLKTESRNAKVLKSLIAIYDKHPECVTLGAALKAENVTLEQVLAA